MRVLAIVQSYFPFQDRGGPVFKVRSIAEGLTRRGHEATILTANLGLQGNGLTNIKFERCEWGWQSQMDGVKAIYLPTFAHYRALTLNLGVIRFSGASLKGFDVVHIFGLYDLLGPVVSHFCRRDAIPYVIEPMGMHRPIIRNLGLKRLYHRLLGARMVAGARFLVATSEQERQELVESGVEQFRVVVRRNGVDGPPNGPNRGEFRNKWKIAPDSKMILFLGRLVSKKSPDLLLQAFARWRSKDPQTENSVLVFAGPEENDNFGSELRSLAGRLGVTKNTVFTGSLYDDQKWQAYRDADVFVLPSQNENFGNTAAESAACGTPVIVTDRCGIAPYVCSAGLVIRHDIEELEEALERILGDESFRRACQRGCVQMANALSWQEPLAETEHLYRRCLSERVVPENMLQQS